MTTFSNLSVCSALHMEWDSAEGKHYKALLITPIAGKIPNKRLIPTLLFRDVEKFRNGDYLFMSFYEAATNEKLGRLYTWTVISKVDDSDLENLIKKVGPPSIVNSENPSLPYNEGHDFLEKEKVRFEAETKFYKAEAYQKHLQRETDSKNSESNLDNTVRGYDSHDIYTAFDGDSDSMNEFLGNH